MPPSNERVVAMMRTIIDLQHKCTSPPEALAVPSSNEAPPPLKEVYRLIRRDTLCALGATGSMIAAWLAEGLLRPTTCAGLYERTPKLDEYLAARRVVGRGHLRAMGVATAAINRWLRNGVLRKTTERGFYQITQVAFDGLCPITDPLPPPPHYVIAIGGDCVVFDRENVRHDELAEVVTKIFEAGPAGVRVLVDGRPFQAPRSKA